MVAGKGLKLPTLLGVSSGGAESTNGDVGITRGGRQYHTGVRRDRMDDWGEDINAKDALVSL